MRSGGGAPRVFAAVLVVLLGVLVLVWSAGSGSPLVTQPQGTWGPPPVTLPVPTEQPAAPTAPAGTEPEPTESQLVDLLLLVFGMLLLLAVLIVLRWLAGRRFEARQRRPDREEDELVALLEASGEEVRYRALTEGDPRNAVVACWVALEEAVHRSGLRVDPALTAAELTGRVLTRWRVDAAAITALSQAYREARFSRHPVTEAQRTAAVDALARIHADLQGRAGEQEP